MTNKDKLGWMTRLKLCWAILTKGEYNPTDYRTRHAQKQWKICEQRRKDLEATIRPSTSYTKRQWDD